jgi:uncharacterized protein
MTSGQDIDYEALAHDAMRTVVRSVLTRIAKTGLPGEHHFYIAFNTQAPGVTISKRLKEKYPEEMTIVLQHRFWDLIVSEERFEVKLTFDSIPERLVVPFSAVKVFFDPSVPYGLQFEESELTSEASRRLGGEQGADVGSDMPSGLARNDGRGPPRGLVPDRLDKRRERPARRKSDKAAETAPGSSRAEGQPKASPSPAPQRPAGSKPVLAPVKTDEPAQKADQAASSKVVSLDQFRKK